MLDRLRIRKPNLDENLANEFIKTAKDRILLRVGISKSIFPAELESICVEVVSAMYNQHESNHEGVESESVDVFSIKFVNNLLDQYNQELHEYKRLLEKEEDENRYKVRFL